MPLVSMRQLLDHAAENGYGIPAFNVNNLEQVQAVMTAAAEVGAPVILQASAGARKYAGRALHQAPDPGRAGAVAADPAGDAPGPRPESRGVPRRHRPGFQLGDDGRQPGGRRQEHRQLRVQRRRHAPGGRHGTRPGRDRRRGAGLPGQPGNHARRQGRRPRHRRHDDPRATADRPRAGGRFRAPHAAGRAGHRHRHQPWRLQVHPQAHGRHPGDRPHQGDPPPHPEHPPGDARQLQRAAGPAGDHPPVRWRDEGDLRRAGGRDPGSHQARRAQDQHRHRHPAGDDRVRSASTWPRTPTSSTRATT